MCLWWMIRNDGAAVRAERCCHHDLVQVKRLQGLLSRRLVVEYSVVETPPAHPE